MLCILHNTKIFSLLSHLKLETENSDFLLLKINKSINRMLVTNQFINYLVSYLIILISWLVENGDTYQMSSE